MGKLSWKLLLLNPLQALAPATYSSVPAVKKLAFQPELKKQDVRIKYRNSVKE